ncbi:MAG: methyltransferase domain-containing protein [Rhizomicrobium sp.]
MKRVFDRVLDIVLDDEERLAAGAEAYDLATSVLSLHTVNDLPGVLLQVRQALRPDGLFLAALFGGEDAYGVAPVFRGRRRSR